jgi:predicted DNA-binding transcriptional regulator AlpA
MRKLKQRDRDTSPSDQRSSEIPRLMVRAKEACEFISVSQSTWDRLASCGKVPKPITLSRGCVLWRVSDIELWIGMKCPDQKEFEARISSQG